MKLRLLLVATALVFGAGKSAPPPGKDVALDHVSSEGDRVTIDGKVSVIPASTGPNGPIPKHCYVDVEWARGG
jgi:hypothetical protein